MKQLNGVLSGYTVIDLSTLLAGPYCSTILGDLGADVIKVEPVGGEVMRYLEIGTEGESSLILGANRNKRGITLNIDKPQGRNILDRLISKCDVVIENFRPDIKAKYKLTYENLSRVKPDIIYLSITAFGESGPYSIKAGTDNVFQGLSGIMTVSGEEGQGPMRIGLPIADMTASLYASIGIIGALLYRQISGEGQHICINLLDAAICMQTTVISDYFMTGEKPVRCGTDSLMAYPVGVFKTADGYITISAFSEKFWHSLCRAIGKEALILDDRFDRPQRRIDNRTDLKPIIAAEILKKKTREWLDILDKFDVPCGPVHDYDSLFMDPQVLYNGLICQLTHSKLKKVKMVGNPLWFGKTPTVHKKAAPMLGEDTDRVLKEFGYSEAQIQELRREEII